LLQGGGQRLVMQAQQLGERQTGLGSAAADLVGGRESGLAAFAQLLPQTWMKTKGKRYMVSTAMIPPKP
jgi:hypothetical protein